MQVTLFLGTTDLPIEIQLQITFVSLLRYVITICADLVPSKPTYTSSNWRVESTLSDSDTNIASNSLTSSSNVGLCVGDSCQHFNIIWYLRKQEKPKTHTICFHNYWMSFFLALSCHELHPPELRLVRIISSCSYSVCSPQFLFYSNFFINALAGRKWVSIKSARGLDGEPASSHLPTPNLSPTPVRLALALLDFFNIFF